MNPKILVIALAFALLWGCASQQEVTNLDDRLVSLERHLKQRHSEQDRKVGELNRLVDGLQERGAVEDQVLRDRSASLGVTLQTLREEIRILNGRLEETTYRLQEEMRQTNQWAQDATSGLQELQQELKTVRQRLVRVEGYLNLEPIRPTTDSRAHQTTPAPATTETDLTSAIEKATTAQELYPLAKQAYDNGEYETARTGFQKLLGNHPDSENADNAQFWIGEIYYQEKWYEKAILEYQQVIEKYPKGNKVRAALLKQGLSFYNIGDKANARLILRELARKYPKSREAQLANKKLSEF